MPPGTVEQFTQTIQPLLMNHCAASGCHSSFGTGKFSLLKVPAGRPPARHLTQANLIAVMQLVNGNQPSASPITLVPVHPHGGSKAAVFTDQQVAQYREMVNWVYRVTRRPVPADHVVASSYEQIRPSPEPSEPSAADRATGLQCQMRGTRSRTYEPPARPATAAQGKKNPAEPAGCRSRSGAAAAEKPGVRSVQPRGFQSPIRSAACRPGPRDGRRPVPRVRHPARQSARSPGQ